MRTTTTHTGGLSSLPEEQRKHTVCFLKVTNLSNCMLATLAAIRVAARDGEAEHLWHRTNNRWFEFYIPKN